MTCVKSCISFLKIILYPFIFYERISWFIWLVQLMTYACLSSMSWLFLKCLWRSIVFASSISFLFANQRSCIRINIYSWVHLLVFTCEDFENSGLQVECMYWLELCCWSCLRFFFNEQQLITFSMSFMKIWICIHLNFTSCCIGWM